MTTKESKQMNQMQNRFLNQQILFKRGPKHQKTPFFDHHSNNGQLNHIASQQRVFHYPAAPLQFTDKQRVTYCDPYPTNRGQRNQINVGNDTFLRNSVSKQKIQRTFSSKKFDIPSAKQARKRTKKMMPNIFQYMMKKQSTSKKSTDESSSAPIENLKAQNEEYLQKIRQQQVRMKRMEKAISQQKKLHELQKHMYNHNIEKLKKLAGIVDNYEEQGQEDDSISVESN